MRGGAWALAVALSSAVAAGGCAGDGARAAAGTGAGVPRFPTPTDTAGAGGRSPDGAAGPDASDTAAAEDAADDAPGSEDAPRVEDPGSSWSDRGPTEDAAAATDTEEPGPGAPADADGSDTGAPPGGCEPPCPDGEACVDGSCEPLPMTCLPGCSDASDCELPAAAGAYTAEHYSCVEGACRYEGCWTDAECMETAAPGWPQVCAPPPGFPEGVPVCQLACAVASDCAVGEIGGAYGEGHWACADGGVCQWLGCTTDESCVDALGAGYGCAPSGSAAAPVVGLCLPTCAVAADCAVGGDEGAYGPSSYVCVSGLCQWLGCATDAQCAESAGGPSVCATP